MRGHLLGLMALLAVGTVASASGVVPLVDATKLHRAAVSGDWVVWAEYGASYNTASIYAINVANPKAEGRIVVANATALVDTWAYWNAQFAVDGHSVFWVDSSATSGPASQVFQFDLLTQAKKVIGPTEFGLGQRAGYPSASGSRVVWQAWAYENKPQMALMISDPWTGDPGDPESPPPAALEVFQRETDIDPYQDAWPVPSISGDWVVWKDDRPSKHGGLWAYNLVSQEKVMMKAPQFDSSTGLPLFDVRAPVIDGNAVDGYKVAWCQRAWDYSTETPTSVHQIMTFDLSHYDPEHPEASQKIIVEDTGSPEHRSEISISGNVVVWEDWSSNVLGPDDIPNLLTTDAIRSWTTAGADVNIRAWDLINDQEIEIPGAATGALELRPWIDGNRVVWYEAALAEGASQRTLSLRWAEIVLPVVPGVLGDVNMDGLINALDIGAFVDRLVTRTYQVQADINKDGLINALDIGGFVQCLVHQSCGGVAGGGVVPEPGSGVMLAIGLLASLRRR